MARNWIGLLVLPLTITACGGDDSTSTGGTTLTETTGDADEEAPAMKVV